MELPIPRARPSASCPAGGCLRRIEIQLAGLAMQPRTLPTIETSPRFDWLSDSRLRWHSRSCSDRLHSSPSRLLIEYWSPLRARYTDPPTLDCPRLGLMSTSPPYQWSPTHSPRIVASARAQLGFCQGSPK